ncbi:NTP transferase domain-containing protein [Halanaeroarchaeum sulfurireducens]|uniref:Adenosylcobinamide-phosphate guanylyltransferase n=1 Tax=Halanaeroarchaeum sulfurireducens TaxID=1604004 RepID=A0A0F7PBU1_9EURY|nr:NTP transferase domain-containing protein [Halanaeroarchaeum sulfurireducens]AKH96808.1 adenosylcobinamide-phosphate guanylyltransferase [Halanaeroarchaeum sulfurireducens]ALG81210.1 adenosylcobinamide-phosphate guanylyltransferase [Halanaeroarchaeum sulfurireducens]
MAGGAGTRLGRGEKPLYEIGGVPMIDRVVGALTDSDVDRIRVVTSPHTPETAAHVDVSTLRTPGDGYVADLERALAAVDLPVLTVTADLPLLTGPVVDRILEETGNGSTAVCVPIDLPRRLGATVDTTMTGGGATVDTTMTGGETGDATPTVDGTTVVPTGVNVVGDTDRTETLVMRERTLAVNVNRPRDARVAEVLA